MSNLSPILPALFSLSFGLAAVSACSDDDATATATPRDPAPAAEASEKPTPPRPPAATAPSPAPKAPTTKPPAPDRERDGYCSLEISGAVEDTFEHVGGGTRGFATDFWQDEPWEELAFRTSLFWLNCGDSGSDYLLAIVMPSGTTPQNFAYAPRELAFARNARPGKNEIDLMMAKTPHNGLIVNSSGTLTLTQFDDGGVAGTFSLAAERDGEPAKVTGEFRYPCTLSSNKCRSQRR